MFGLLIKASSGHPEEAFALRKDYQILAVFAAALT